MLSKLFSEVVEYAVRFLDATNLQQCCDTEDAFGLRYASHLLTAMFPTKCQPCGTGSMDRVDIIGYSRYDRKHDQRVCVCHVVSSLGREVIQDMKKTISSR